MIKIGLNGFGRIGRAITRIVLKSVDCQLNVINELDPDIGNATYLLNYDSIYGRFSEKISADEQRNALICNGGVIPVYSFANTEHVPWERHDIDVLIDATGVKANVLAAHRLIERGIPKIVITHSPDEVDTTIILGVNENEYDPKKHHVISSSICDASAIAPVLFEINKLWEIENCFVTTLHPWLSYQNLLDGSVSSVSSPGHYWKDYSLGRSSIMNLIPKDTTAAKATLKVLTELKGKIDAISFRVPTSIVSASDMTILVKNKTSTEEVNSHFKRLSEEKEDIFELIEECLVSIDHQGTNKSAIIDAVRTKVLNERMIKMVVWYDNEWGYSNKVVDIARLITKKSGDNHG
jgi:glyceraldehyde 3-phosphate dehydrogenase